MAQTNPQTAAAAAEARRAEIKREAVPVRATVTFSMPDTDYVMKAARTRTGWSCHVETRGGLVTVVADTLGECVDRMQSALPWHLEDEDAVVAKLRKNRSPETRPDPDLDRLKGELFG